MPSFRERLVAFYDKYNPEKKASISTVLHSFRGRETALFAQLVQKYGPEPDDASATAAADAASASASASTSAASAASASTSAASASSRAAAAAAAVDAAEGTEGKVGGGMYEDADAMGAEGDPERALAHKLRSDVSQFDAATPADLLRHDKIGFPADKPACGEHMHGWFLDTHERVFAQLVDPKKTKCIVELGSWYGQSTKRLAQMAPNATVYAVDLWSEDWIDR